MTSIERLFEQIDRTYAERFGTPCRSRLHRVLDTSCDNVDYRLTKQPDGTYEVLRQSRDLAATPVLPLGLAEARQLSVALGHLQAFDLLRVQIGEPTAALTFELQLVKRGEAAEAHYHQLPSFWVCLPPNALGDPPDPGAERALKRYLQLLSQQDRQLARALAKINSYLPDYLTGLPVT
jgi:hypothetical protein